MKYFLIIMLFFILTCIFFSFAKIQSVSANGEGLARGLESKPGEFEPILDTSNSTILIEKPHEAVPEAEIPKQKEMETNNTTNTILMTGLVFILLLMIFVFRIKRRHAVVTYAFIFLLTINSANAFLLGQWNPVGLTFNILNAGDTCYNDDAFCGFIPHCIDKEDVICDDGRVVCSWNPCPYGCCDISTANLAIISKTYINYWWRIRINGTISQIRGSVFNGSIRAKSAFKCNSTSTWHKTDWSSPRGFSTEKWRGCNDESYRCFNESRISAPINTTTGTVEMEKCTETTASPAFCNLYGYKIFNNGTGFRVNINWNFMSDVHYKDCDKCSSFDRSFCTNKTMGGHPQIPGPPSIEMTINAFFVPNKPTLNSPANNTLLQMSSKPKPDLSFTTVNKGDGYNLSIYKWSSGAWQRINYNTYKRVTQNPDSGIPMSFAWTEYSSGLNPPYSDGFPAGKYNWTVTSCSYLLNDVYDCFDGEPTSSFVFGVKPNITIRVSNTDGSGAAEFTTGQTPFYGVDKKIEAVCDTGGTGNCDAVKLKIYDSLVLTCPSTWSEYTDNSPGNIQGTKWICAAGYKDSTEVIGVSGPLKVRIDKTPPHFIAPKCAKPNQIFSVIINDSGTYDTTTSGLDTTKLKYCETDNDATCTPNLDLTCTQNPVTAICTNDTQTIPGKKKRLYGAADIMNNQNTTTVSTSNISISINFPQNNTWVKTNIQAVLNVNSYCDYISWIGNCSNSTCNPLDSSLPITKLENTGGTSQTLTRTYQFSAEGETNITYGANNTNPWDMFAQRDGIRVKIDKTQPNIYGKWSDGSPLSEAKIKGNAIVIDVNDSKTGVNHVSGIDTTKYCITQTTCTPNDIPTPLSDFGYFKNYSVSTTNLEPGLWVLNISSNDNAENTGETSILFAIKGIVTGNVSYPSGFWNKTFVSVTVLDTTNTPPGPADNFELFYKTAGLSNGICGTTYTADMQYNGIYAFPPNPKTVTFGSLSTGKCHKFTAKLYKDIEYGIATNTSELKVDYTLPIISVAETPTIPYISPTGTKWAKTFNVSWTAADAHSGFEINPITLQITEDDIIVKTTQSLPQNSPPEGYDIPSQIPGGFKNDALYRINISANDRAGNFNYNGSLAIKIDTQPPTCTLNISNPLTPIFNTSWSSNDLESGTKEYAIGLKDALGNIVNINEYCTTTAGTPISNSVIFDNFVGSMQCPWTEKQEGKYNFTCYATDNVGNIGQLNETETTVVINPVNSGVSVPRWANKDFNILLGASNIDDVQCFYLQYKINAGAWVDYIYGGSNCLPKTQLSYPFLVGFYNEGDNVTFRVSSKKITGVLEEWSCCSALADPYFSCSDNPPNCANDANRIKVATIDITNPEALIERITTNYIGYNIFVPTSSDLKLRLRMRDNTSGINSSYVFWSGTNAFFGSGCSATSPGSNVLNCSSTAPYNTTFAVRELSAFFVNLTLIELIANIIDHAGNANETLYYITDHPFASPDSEDVFLFVGESYVLGLAVRNLLPAEQTISIQLSGYPLANFIDGGRTKTFVLKAGEAARAHIQIKSEMPPSTEPITSALNIEATSNVITSYADTTAVKITTGWPSSFSAFGEIAIVLSILISLAVFAKFAIV